GLGCLRRSNLLVDLRLHRLGDRLGDFEFYFVEALPQDFDLFGRKLDIEDHQNTHGSNCALEKFASRRKPVLVTLMVKCAVDTAGVSPLTEIEIEIVPGLARSVLLRTVTTPVAELIWKVPVPSVSDHAAVPVVWPAIEAVPRVVPFAEP